MTTAHASAHAALRAAPRRAAALRPPQSPRPTPCPTSRACPGTAAPCRSHLYLFMRPPPPPDNPKAAQSRRPARPAPAIRKSHQLPANNLRALEEILRVRRSPWPCASLHCHCPAPSSLQHSLPPPAATTQGRHAPSSTKGACFLSAHQACVLARPCLASSQPGNRRRPASAITDGSSGSR